MRIIFIGAPGTGKGTQAQWITKKYLIPKISAGDILRDIASDNTELSKKIKSIINSGKLVDDDIITKLIKSRIKKKDCYKGFLLDGFPRTIAQADNIKKINIKIDFIIEFKITEKLMLQRIQGRRIHTESGRIYHIIFNPPKIENQDDVTGQPLTIRKDDSKEKLKKRIEEYKNFTIPLIKYYKKEAKLGNVKYFTINACKTQLNVQNNIKNIINENLLS